MVGIETAEYLQEQCDQVTVVEMRDVIAPDMPAITKAVITERLKDNVKLMTGVAVKSIEPSRVVMEQDGRDATIAGCDLVILAAGYRGSDELGAKISEALPNVKVYTVGDCNRARTAWQAIQEGNAAGRSI